LEPITYIQKEFRIPRIGKIPLYVVILITIFLLAVLQDYIYSRLKHTGFYLSESLLYNTFWVFFIPLTIFTKRLIKILKPKNKWLRISYNVSSGLTFSFLHILLFSAFFVLISTLIYDPSHRFSTMFNAAFSNQFYIALLWYALFPFVYFQKKEWSSSAPQNSEKIKLKIGSKIVSIYTNEIQVISTDKPYAAVFANNQKFLDYKSLKQFEAELNPSIFVRVHRSALVNVTYIKELKSRSNGDYDALLENGQLIRFSRHYRNNWSHLLQ